MNHDDAFAFIPGHAMHENFDGEADIRAITDSAQRAREGFTM